MEGTRDPLVELDLRDQMKRQKPSHLRSAIALLVLFASVSICSSALAYSGKVVDASTHAPLADAIVTLGDLTARTNRDGIFEINGPGDSIGFRAYGYMRESLPASGFTIGRRDVALTAFQPKALYLSFYGIGSSKLREAALGLIDTTQLNAVVVDIKSDRGMIPYKTSLALAEEIGAERIITIADARNLLEGLHREHLYVIARIVVFKDDLLSKARPDLAVKRSSGAIFKDREDSGWTDAFSKEAWNYNIAIAVEAASLGFDEIQFDYVRFPDEPGLVFSMPNTLENRLAAVTGFLEEAHKRLVPYNVFLAADIFGYVMWSLDDTHIGQRLQELSSVVDYISPMLYPSCFQFGIPGYRLPVAHPYEIVFNSLQEAHERTGIAPIRVRPWLQAFRDYAFDRRLFGGSEIKAQIAAAEDFGTDGWMLWNPQNIYSPAGLESDPAACVDARITSTEQCACMATASETLPSISLSIPR